MRWFLHSEISLDLSLVDAVHRDPGEEASNEAAPESVTTTKVWLEVEQLHPAAVIVALPDGGGASHVLVPLDDDRQEAAEHAGGLEDIRPDDSFDAANSRVEYTDSEYDEAGNVQVEARDLG